MFNSTRKPVQKGQTTHITHNALPPPPLPAHTNTHLSYQRPSKKVIACRGAAEGLDRRELPHDDVPGSHPACAEGETERDDCGKAFRDRRHAKRHRNLYPPHFYLFFPFFWNSGARGTKNLLRKGEGRGVGQSSWKERKDKRKCLIFRQRKADRPWPMYLHPPTNLEIVQGPLGDARQALSEDGGGKSGRVHSPHTEAHLGMFCVCRVICIFAKFNAHASNQSTHEQARGQLTHTAE